MMTYTGMAGRTMQATHHCDKKSNKEVVPYDNLNIWGENLSQTEGVSNQSEKLRPPSLTCKALVLISHVRLDWKEFNKY